MEHLPFYVAQLAYGLSFVSFCFGNVTRLRWVAILSSAAAVYYAVTATTSPEWIPILWNAGFIAANGTHLLLSRLRSREVKLDPLEDFLAKTVIQNFPTFEVRSFASLAAEGNLAMGAQLIRSGTKIDQLYCVLKGKVNVMVKGHKVAELGPGRFIGEMSLLTRAATRADVVVESDLKALVWTHEKIESWVNGDARRLGLLQSALGTQVVEELLRQQSERNEAKEVA